MLLYQLIYYKNEIIIINIYKQNIMYSKKEAKNNLALKSLIIKNKQKNFFLPLLNEQSRNISLKSNKTSMSNTNKKEYSDIFMKKVQLNQMILINKKKNTINNIGKIDTLNKELIKKNNITKELLKNKSFQKYSTKKIITAKSFLNITNKNIIKKNNKLSKKIFNTISNNNNSSKTNMSQKNNNLLLNNLDYYYSITEDSDSNYKTNRTNIVNAAKLKNEKEKNFNKEKRIFGIMLKKMNFVNNNFINNKIDKSSNNYYLYEKNLGRLANNSFKVNTNRLDPSLFLKKNYSGSNTKIVCVKNKNSQNKNNNIIYDYYNDEMKKKMKTITSNNNNSTSHIKSIQYLNRITLNNYNNNKKKLLKLNLLQNLNKKKIKLKKSNNKYNYNSNNTINITIDNSVNNIYDNVININRNPKITYININNNNNNITNIHHKKKANNNKNELINSHNLIMLFQKNKTKEKNNKKLQQIVKENLKKIHEKKKKKKLLISINNIRKVKFLGIKEIFSNFTKIKEICPKFATPKINMSFQHFNKINFSGRFNRTEDKSIDFFTTMSEKYKSTNSKIKEDPQYVYEYYNEILTNLLIDENNYFEELDLSHLNLNKISSVINPDSRKFFINSLINLQELLNFKEHTLFLTTQIFDRYINYVLKKRIISIKEENLDIVIVTSLIIAAKNDEIKLYSMKDYLNLLPLKYNIRDLEKTEYEILSGFDFNLNIPNMLNFFELFCLEGKLNKIQIAKGLYLLNFILLDNNLVQIPPSLIAYAVVFIISGKKIQLNKINKEYEYNGEKKIIKILPMLKDKEMINNLYLYIKYLYKININSPYNAPFNKFNVPSFYYIPSYLDI